MSYDLAGYKTRVDKVNIDGINRTKDDFVIRMVKEIFKATNFEQVVIKAHEIRSQLEALGVFKNIGISIDTSKGENASDDGLEVTYNIQEMGRAAGGVSTMIGNNNDGSILLQLRLPNLLGRAETLNADYQYGTIRTAGLNLSFAKPIAPWSWAKPKLMASIFQYGADAPWSGYRETDRGGNIDLSFTSVQNLQHSLRWEGVWRDISSLPVGTAFAVREECGHTLKSSIRHTITLDKRDNLVLPNRGLFLRLQQEYAGLGGNVGFHKHEFEMQYNTPIIFRDAILQLSYRTGMLKPLQKIDSVTCINDRFFLGGPLTLRGYDLYGIGPHVENCALGGNTYWLGGLHLYTPLPFRPGRGGFGDLFRTHFFFNAGNIGDFAYTDDYYKNLNTALNRVRFSGGCGIVLSIAHMARFELNYCVPWGNQAGDKSKAGLQFGIGVNFA